MAWRIRTVSDRTGVNIETLRSWERRYELVQPARSAGGYRLYSDDDVAVIERVKTLVDGGLAISEAVEQARREGVVPELPTPSIRTLRPGRDEPEPARARPAPGGALGASRSALITALLDVDRPRVDAILAALPPLSWDRLARDMLLPAAREIATLQHRGTATYVQDRFAAQVVRERLMAMISALGSGPAAGPEAICIGAPAEEQDLGLLGATLHLATRGWRVTCLGADFPPGELAAFLETRRPGLLMVTMERPRLESERRDLLQRLRIMASPMTRVVAGGPGARGEGERIEGVVIARSFDDLPSP
ncbi:MAG: MerR family transcriptional regulator [Proteobacteria bacterium]|nr:MerR family transcriptional regulator [Pseudomonadota bacterium]